MQRLMVKPLPSQEELCALLRYELDTGKLYWRERPVSMFTAYKYRSAEGSASAWNDLHAGKEALISVNRKGHLYGTLWKDRFLAHRVIWKMVHGVDPDNIDHINGNPSDNRLSNLRSVTNAENHKNMKLMRTNTSGVCGVKRTPYGTWAATGSIDNRNKHIGTFASKADAIAARKMFEANHGYHPNHGRVTA